MHAHLGLLALVVGVVVLVVGVVGAVVLVVGVVVLVVFFSAGSYENYIQEKKEQAKTVCLL